MIPIAEPVIGKEEIAAVTDAMKSGFISGNAGSYIDRFENEFSRYCRARHGITTTNGTTALHLALAALGIGPGDEVITSPVTNIATLYAIVYTGATPVLVDCEPDTWNMNVQNIAAKITPKTKAILPVHIYGHPCDMDPILELARQHSLRVIEDDAEVHGAEYKGKRLPVGDVGCFSFYANKIITTGEGGMVVTNDDDIATTCRELKNMDYGKQERFKHERLAFNYRMTNVQAAIGWAQLQKIDAVIEQKRRLADWYTARLAETLTTPIERPYAKNVYWMYGVLAKDAQHKEAIRSRLAAQEIETRDFFKPMHQQPVFQHMGLFAGESHPVAEDLYARGFYLPSGITLTEQDVEQICAVITQA